MFNELSTSLKEGDVEMQVVVPLLTEGHLLNHNRDDVRSKEFFKPIDIGKGNTSRKGYFPDYGIYIKALPVCIVEAKRPSIDAETGYEEATLYAHEINKYNESGTNPCQVVIATNGIRLLAGYWGTKPKIIVSVADLSPGSKALSDLQEICGVTQLNSFANSISERLRFTDFKRPFNQGEGASLINSKKAIILSQPTFRPSCEDISHRSPNRRHPKFGNEHTYHRKKLHLTTKLWNHT